MWLTNGVILTMPYLKVPLIVWLHKIFKLIFLRQPSCPNIMYSEHWRISEDFFYTFRKAILWIVVKSCLLECATVFPSKNKVFEEYLVNRHFDVLLWFSSTILLYKMKLLFFKLSASPLVTNISNDYCRKYVLIDKLKDFRQWHFDKQFECTGFSSSKVLILKSIHLININSVWNCLKDS